MKLSLIIPVYNEQDNVLPLYNKLKAVLEYDHELIFIDDGSKDNTYEILKNIQKKDSKLKIIRFRNNFGKSEALSKGFKHAKGDIIITMDGDLQDDPEEIPRFTEKIKEGYDLVVGWKYKRQDPLSKTIPSKFFNFLIKVLTGVKIHDSNCCFKAYKKEVVKNLKIYGELHRYIPSLVNWKGFKVTEIKVKHHKRLHGKSKYGFSRLLKGFLDLLTIKFLIKYSKKPLHFFGSIGIISFLLGALISVYLVYEKYFLNINIGSRPMLILGVLLLIIGVQFICLGLLGEMILNMIPNNEEELGDY